MTVRNRNHRSVYPKLGLTFLFVLFALVPSMASARTAMHEATSVTICTPTATNCSTWVKADGQVFWDKIDGAGMPEFMWDYCAYNPTYCTRSMGQQWAFQTYSQWVNWRSVSSPGNWWTCPVRTPGGLYYQCRENDDQENYTCKSGTGGPWGQWTISVNY
jgi:hypothetical protein